MVKNLLKKVLRLGLKLSIFAALLFFTTSLHAQFSKISGANGLDDSSGGRVNGQAWGDVDNDGDLDVIFHIGAGGSATNGRLFINSGAPNFTFADSTASLINGFNDNVNFGRQMLIVDFNNDGYNDILRGFGSFNPTEIYFNNGPPHYTFGDATQQPDLLIGAPGDGQEFNTEGIAAVDWNQDGWLDIIVDNDGGGNDVYENDMMGGFTYISPGTDVGQTGFPASHSGDGDYMTAADVDNDGYVDLYGRKTAVSNYWYFNSTTKQFETQANPNIVSSESDKGGTMFCDFDNDGDLDLLWTSQGTNQIWRNDGANVWTATGIPAAPIATQTNIDGCDCGDYDNDGDIDIILGASGGNSYLLENTTTGGTLSFTTNNLATSANTESVTFTDFDNDGDMDLYFVVDGAANQLWENSTDDNNFLYVNAMYDNGNSSQRDAIGANIMLHTCEGDTLQIRQVNGGKGHGSQHQKKVHFGLAPDNEYMIQVNYVYKNGSRSVVRKAVIPSQMPNQEFTVLDSDTDDTFACTDKDMDGVYDQNDLDDDNDGIPDVEEDGGTGFNPHGDADGDGILNVYDSADATSGFPAFTDSNNDGLNDAYDSDGDGIADFIDLDADNDGIPDIIEAGGIDTNGDGQVDYPTPNDPTSMVDVDGDGLDDGLDDQDSGSGGSEVTNGTALANPDSDNDNLADALDLDADNDGIPDLVEIGGIDSNGDGLVDVSTDADNDGFADVYDPDDDGTPGVDSGEDTNPLVETDGSGVFLNGATGASLDTDGDGFTDHLDLDADNDGIPDIVEAGGSDPDNDGKVDTGLAPWDSDEDGLADVYDENNSGTSLVKTTADTNSDGKINATETMLAGGSNNINVDTDVAPNHLDPDSDNDGITDVVENASGDTDADNGGSGDLDGTVNNYTDVADSNGWNDSSNSTTTDTDGDGIPDYLDIDADNDGIVDYREGVCSTCPTFTIDPVANDTDTDQDGVLDIYEDLTSANATGGTNKGTNPNIDDNSGNSDPDYLDTDTDNDGTFDWTEGYDANNNGQAADDLILTAASYEMATSNGFYTTADADSDGLPDWMDNQPSIAGFDENARPPFLDPLSSFWHDEDGDGLVDLLDTTEGGGNAPTPDHNGGDDLDWRDNTIAAPLPVELVSFTAKMKKCDVLLEWVAASEENFDYYEIQRSSDGSNFSKLTTITGKGQNGGLIIYDLIDDQVTENNYYRLKMIDIDNTFEFSKVIHIKSDCIDENEMNVFPNPVGTKEGVLSIKVFSNIDEQQFIVVNMQGVIVKGLNLGMEQGWNHIRLDVSDLPVGTYFFKQLDNNRYKQFTIQE